MTRPMMATYSRGWLSVRRVILLAGVFIVFRLTWISIQNLLQQPNPLDINDLPPNTDFDELFKPKECIVGPNNTCMPINPDDVYLGRGLYAHKSKFYLDGRPFRIFSGSFHYFRTQPAQWGDRLLKMKAAGLNTVTTYVPWNLHEPVKGQYMFSGVWDLASFIKQAQKIGLKVIVRPGPYICAEWEFGGLPAWLLQDPHMSVRTSYKPYLRHVSEYFSKLLSILAPLAYKKGGPVIAFQVENEYGSFAGDKIYLQFIVELLKKWGINELLFTSDGTRPNQLQQGTLPGILATVNFKKDQAKHLKALLKFQPGKPLMVTEFWPGWFDHWGKNHHTMGDAEFKEYVSNILKYGASINFYMLVGGTNFGFWNGANHDDKRGYEPTVTSYDYDAPISEDGNLTQKFFTLRTMLSKFIQDPGELLDISTVMNTIHHQAYGTVQIEDWMSYKILTDIAEDYSQSRYGDKIFLNKPVNMEKLKLVNGCGQSTGWILYRTKVTLGKPEMLTLKGNIYDRAQFLVNYKELAVYYRKDPFPQITLPPSSTTSIHELISSSTLDILVENMGRVNYLHLNDQHKGIMGEVFIGQNQSNKWIHIPLDFDDEFIAIINQHKNWQTYVSVKSIHEPTVVVAPALYRTTLNFETQPMDTYLDMKGWNKGIVIVNGFILGRYWHVGPQRTLYVPAPLLVQGRNIFTVFELHKPHDTLTFIDRPILDDRW